ncbi:glycoside hydrolase family 108 protein [Bosea vaviloviae]|uniref:N-acetylmuramidase n=1 Tax=Bosea vaviloviae TaxID=1526658 RepID=A0A1D7U2T3_9HYPH|nr:glycoside hydrolase family 108 protein [Bosea vaviloviae]AOO81673.1 N-acetylmuramidase [Bosea vaviloviae]
MTTQNFAAALKRVLVHEGGKVDHPRDPGGRTNQGVIQRVYDGYRARKGRPKHDVYLMETTERDEIYRAQYWDAVRGDDLPAGIDYVVFDGAVNSGPAQSVKWLQRALGGVKVDGEFGEATLAAVAAHPDHDALIAAICARRMAFLKALRNWSTFGRGWTSRVSGVRAIGQAWASGSVGPVLAHAEGGNAKATIGQAVPAASPAVGDVAIGGGVATGGLGGALQQAQDALSPLAGNSALIGNIVAALVVTGAVITIGGILYRLWARRKAAAQADALDLAVPA